MPLSENSKAALQVHSLLCDSTEHWRTAFNRKRSINPTELNMGGALS